MKNIAYAAICNNQNGYQSKKQRDIKFYYLADSANYMLGFKLCKVDKFTPKDRYIILNLRV